MRFPVDPEHLLLSGVTDYAIYMLDPSGVILSWNTGGERIKGYSDAEVLGEHFSKFYTAEDRAAGEPDRALATAAREGRYEAEGWRVRKDGSRFRANIVIDAIWHEGRHVGFAKITRDITERYTAADFAEHLGWPHATQTDVALGWKKILGTVRSYADLEPSLLGRVEELIDFVTAASD